MNLKEIIENRNINFETVIKTFEETILPEVQLKINSGRFHRMSSKLISELLPTNQRNLTDARTRIGTLLEYQFAFELNNLIKDKYLLSEYDVGFVLANQYPDLVIRNEFHEVVLRIEMKSIQGISEEKSANFDALIRNIEKETDLLCIILWEWEETDEKVAGVEFPKISKIYLFDAYEIAKMRDYGWLKNTTSSIGNKIIDVSGVYVPVSDTVYKQEEGNIGKLLRVSTFAENNLEANRYEIFKKEVQLFGIQQIVKNLVRLNFDEEVVFDSNQYDNTDVQKIYDLSNEKINLLILAGNRRSKTKINTISKEKLTEKNIDSTYVVIMNEKFDWTLFEVTKDSILKINEGNKPQTLYEKVATLF